VNERGDTLVTHSTQIEQKINGMQAN
jgi:hypothetical protein